MTNSIRYVAINPMSIGVLRPIPSLSSMNLTGITIGSVIATVNAKKGLLSTSANSGRITRSIIANEIISRNTRTHFAKRNKISSTIYSFEKTNIC